MKEEKRQEKREQWAEMGRRLKVIRQNLHMTQYEFADFIGTRQSLISWAERGQRGIPASLLAALGEKGYDVNWLTLGKEVDHTGFHLQRADDLINIENALDKLDDDAVHLTWNWIKVLFDYQRSEGKLRKPIKKQEKEKQDET